MNANDIEEKIFNLENNVLAMGQLISNLKFELELFLEVPIEPVDFITKCAKVMPDSVETVSNKEEFFNCDECGYKCKQKVTIKKHNTTKHCRLGETCKQFKQVFVLETELMKHVAEKHSLVKDKDIEISDEAKTHLRENQKSGLERDLESYDYSEYDGDMMECVGCPK